MVATIELACTCLLPRRRFGKPPSPRLAAVVEVDARNGAGAKSHRPHGCQPLGLIVVTNELEARSQIELEQLQARQAPSVPGQHLSGEAGAGQRIEGLQWLPAGAAVVLEPPGVEGQIGPVMNEDMMPGSQLKVVLLT